MLILTRHKHLAANFCPWATYKNHMLGTLDFVDSEHWAPFNFPYNTALLQCSVILIYVVQYV